MDDSFRAKLLMKLDAFRKWRSGRTFQAARLIQYCGADHVGTIDVPLADVESHIEGVVCEGFHIDWTDDKGLLFLRVWEYGGPEPDWPNVIAKVL